MTTQEAISLIEDVIYLSPKELELPRDKAAWNQIKRDAKLGAAFRRVAPLIYQMRDDQGGDRTSVNLETHGYEHNIYAATVLEAVEELARQVKE